MTTSALILTYHAIEAGRGPLCLDPHRFAEHLDCLQARGATTLTMGQLAASLRVRELPRRAVAITFDDGFASVADVAAPMLLERGMSATVFCVAGHLGGVNDWSTQPVGAPRRGLASKGQLIELAGAGFEIGAHGMEHLPLVLASPAELRRELLDARATLEQAVGVHVRSFAYPYGARPSAVGTALLREAYDAACTTTLALVAPDADPVALPRVDAHYVRRVALLDRAVDGSLGYYLGARRLAAQVRRAIHKDYVPAGKPESRGK